jgi:hypothetical protein
VTLPSLAQIAQAAAWAAVVLLASIALTLLDVDAVIRSS